MPVGRKKNINWSEVVKKLRGSMGKSLDKFGLLLSVAGRTIARWEGGESIPGPRQRLKLIKLLKDMDMEYLIGSMKGGDEMTDPAFANDVKSIFGKVKDLSDTSFKEFCNKMDEYKREREKNSPLNWSYTDRSDAPEEYNIIAEFVEDKNWDFVIPYGKLMLATLEMEDIFCKRVQNIVGNALFYTGKYSEAREYFEIALDNCEDSNLKIKLLSNISNTLVRQNQLDNAEVMAKRALEIKNDYATAIYNLLVISVIRGDDSDEIQKRFDILYSLKPDEVSDPSTLFGGALRIDPDLKPIEKEIEQMIAIAQGKSPVNNRDSWYKTLLKKSGYLLIFFILYVLAALVIHYYSLNRSKSVSSNHEQSNRTEVLMNNTHKCIAVMMDVDLEATKVV